MKSAKIAVLALLAVSLTAGGLPAQGGNQLPQPAATAATGEPGAASTQAPALPAQKPISETAKPAATATAPASESAKPAPTPAPAPAPKKLTGTVPAKAEPTPAQPKESRPAEDAGAQKAPAEEEGFDPVVGGGFPVPGPNTPLVTDPDGTVRSAVETDISAAHDHGVSSGQGGAASMSASAARSGTMQVTLVFATLSDNRNGVDENAARNSVVQANNYWRSTSNGRIGMSIAGTKHIDSSASSWQDYGAMMNTIKRDLGWKDSPNTALLVYVPAGELRSGGYGGILGGGWTSGALSGSVLMPRPSAFTNNVVTHEFGHVLGILHANSLKCNNGRSDVGINSSGSWSDGQCTSREYGDTSDLMGYAQYNLPLINSYFWDAGGFGQGNEVRNLGAVGSSATYTLRPWAGSGANRAVKFRDTSGETYYLELRTPVGYDAGTAVGGNRGVKIVKADLANSWAVNSLVVAPNTRDFAGYTNANSTWQAGQTFTTHTGTTVRINSVNADSASVTIVNGAAGRAAGPIAAARAAHPELGSATSAVVDGIRDNGAYQNFSNGAILWSPSTGARVSLKGAIRNAYQKSGFESGALGYPRSDEMTIKGGKYQDFQNGSILWSSATGAQVSLKGAIRDAYQKAGFEGGLLGFPTSGEVTIRGGKYQNFAKGAILWSPATGAQVSLNGPIRSTYQKAGFEGGALGFPTSGEVTIRGGKYQNFANGAILWSTSSGAQVSLNGPIRDAYKRAGFEGGALGFPTTGQITSNGGKYQKFVKGAIYWSPSTGAQVSTSGPIRNAYNKSGKLGGPLGFPTSGEVTIRGGKYQNFARGAILWSPSSGAQVSLNGPIRDAYKKAGFEGGALGFPTTGQIASNGGKYQKFSKGAIYWTPSAGAQVSASGPIRNAYIKSGKLNGPLGFPTSGEVSIKGGKYQNFAKGAILWSSATGAQVSLNGPIRDAYRKAGFEGGRLGFPKSGEYAVGKTRVQDFRGGKIIMDANKKTTIRYN